MNSFYPPMPQRSVPPETPSGVAHSTDARQNSLPDQPGSTKSPVLSSWKEIAAYFGKGVRTVQRWERELNMPVRRPLGGTKRIVIAIPDELRDWLAQASSAPAASHNGSNGHRTPLNAALLTIAGDLLRVCERMVINANKSQQNELQKIITAIRQIESELDS